MFRVRLPHYSGVHVMGIIEKTLWSLRMTYAVVPCQTMRGTIEYAGKEQWFVGSDVVRISDILRIEVRADKDVVTIILRDK